MAENEPPRKRMRYSFRNKRLNYPRYMLRSYTQMNPIEHVELEPKRKHKNQLSLLNPDCLLAIFEYLELKDLCKFAQVSEPLYNLAKYYFRLKYKHLDFAQLFNGETLDTETIRELFRIFGDQIHTLNISMDLFANDEEDVSSTLLLLTNQYCHHIVKHLTLDGFDIMRDVIPKISSLMSSIESLTLDDCYMYRVIWCPMNNLKVLKLHAVGTFWHDGWPSNLNQLEEIHLKDLDIYDDSLIELIDSTSKLKCLSIVKCYEISTSVFDVVSDLKNLEEFEFQLNRRTRHEDEFRYDLLHLTQLKLLNVIKLNCNKMSVLPLIQAFVTNGIEIKYLELADGLFDNDLSICIGQLKALNVLRLNNMIGFNENHMHPITKQLKLLRKLHIRTVSKLSQFRIHDIVRNCTHLSSLKIDNPTFKLHVNTLKSILSTVKSRIVQNQLQIVIYCNGHDQPIPKEIIQIDYQKWIQLNQLNRNTNHLFLVRDFLDEFDSDDDDFAF